MAAGLLTERRLQCSKAVAGIQLTLMRGDRSDDNPAVVALRDGDWHR